MPQMLVTYSNSAVGAGALSAGVNAAIASNAAAGGGFIAGFTGAATISSTGFIAGAGAVGGYVSAKEAGLNPWQVSLKIVLQ